MFYVLVLLMTRQTATVYTTDVVSSQKRIMNRNMTLTWHRAGYITPRGSKGYTLIEAVVSIAIIGILSSIALVGMTDVRRASIVRNAANEFAGRLRETITLSQSGIKSPTCGITSPCSQYRLTVTANTPTYTRDTVNGFDLVSYALPQGAVFADTRTVTVRYRPPVMNVTMTPSGGGPIETLRVQHGADTTTYAFVCIGALGNIEVTQTAC